jgi:hyperosmotically inducible protein
MKTKLWTTAGLVLVLSTLPGRAVDEPPRPPTMALNKIREMVASVKVKRALQEDRVLAPLNLGVTIDHGIVSVWGPIPSQEVGRQVITKLEAIDGVREVRSSFYLPDTGPLNTTERVEVAKPEIETGRLPPPRAPAVAVARREQLSQEGPKLLAPRPRTVSRSEAQATEAKLPKPAVTLTEQVREARQSEARFREIAVEVQGNVVLVHRRDSRSRDVMDFVQKLRRIHGVTDVVLTAD